MNSPQTFQTEIPELLPLDLRQWFDSHALVGLALQAQASIDTSKLNAKPPGRVLVSGHANALLSILTYCYACNMISSQDLEQFASDDPMIRYLCSKRLPSLSSITRFRRNHRATIQDCLAGLFQLAWQKRLSRSFMAADNGRFNPILELSSGICRQIDDKPMRVESVLTLYFKQQAESRVLSAIQCDCMEMDD